MPRVRSACAVLVTALVATLAAACGGDPPQTPEERIRATVAALADAVEAKDTDLLKEHVAEDYGDAGGRGRRELAQMLAFYSMRHQSLHVMARVKDVVLPQPDRAQVVVVAATAGRPIESASDLVGMRAEVYHLDLDMEERDGEWRLVWAQWRPAAPAELF